MRANKRLAIRALTAVVLALVLASGLGASAAFAKKPFKIGAVLAVTGRASFLGEPERNTAVMVVDMINKAGGINGRPIKLIVYDTESNATKTVLAVNKLIRRDKVHAIIGPSTSGTSLAVIPIVTRFKVPLIAFGASAKIASPIAKRRWVFKVVPGDDLAVELMYRYMKRKGIKKVALLTVSTGYGISGRGQLKKLAPKIGLKVVADIVYGPKDSDLTAQLTNARAAGAQAIVNWSIGPTQVVVTRNWKQLGIKIPLYQSYGFGSMRNIKLAGGAAEGVICPVSRIVIAKKLDPKSPFYKVVNLYKRLYEKRFKREVSVFGGHAWDGVYQLAAAFKAVGANRAKIRAYLENLKNFRGNNGLFNRTPQDHVGLSVDSYVMVQVKNGDWAVLK